MRRRLRGAEFLAERIKGCGVFVIPVYITQQCAHLVERRTVDTAVLLEAVLCARPKLVEVPAGLSDTDHRNIEIAPLQHRLQRGEDLLVGQIARCAEEDKGIRVRITHIGPL